MFDREDIAMLPESWTWMSTRDDSLPEGAVVLTGERWSLVSLPRGKDKQCLAPARCGTRCTGLTSKLDYGNHEQPALEYLFIRCVPAKQYQ